MAGAEERGAAQSPQEGRGTATTQQIARFDARHVPALRPATAGLDARSARQAVTGATSMPSSVARVPIAVFLAAAGLLGATALLCGAVALRSSITVTELERHGGAASAQPLPVGATATAPAGAAATAELSTNAPAAELEAARLKGLQALTALAERYPKDPAVLKALLPLHAREQETSMVAVSVARRLLEATPGAASDADLRQVVLRAANGPPDIAGAAFELMSTRMGSYGPDLLYELLIAEKIGKFPKDRAEKLLVDPEVRKLASPALLVACDLRRTTPQCSSKDIIARARDQGDVRSLHYLRQISGTMKCGLLNLSTCERCPLTAADARATVAAIEKHRSPTAP